jgi:hypothetical protein
MPIKPIKKVSIDFTPAQLSALWVALEIYESECDHGHEKWRKLGNVLKTIRAIKRKISEAS